MEDESTNQQRYPTMPSLVALQQMRNRLHLAFLGRKLMKWTTLATAKELRKIAAGMNELFNEYGDDFAKAFMLVARCRYYYPNLNTMVIENVSKAAVRNNIEYRSVAGVKVKELILIEEPFDPNEHLGIEKGGICILETKKAWRDLLKLAVLMLQEREAFKSFSEANKNASKKQNVLGKIIIPRIQNAIAYIKSELEEQEREETFRLKRFKQSKTKKAELAEKKLKKEEVKVPSVPVPCGRTPSPRSISPKTSNIQEPNIIPKKTCTCSDDKPDQDVSSGKFDCPICSLADKNIEINVIACKLCLPGVTEAKHRAEHLMAHINQVLTLTRYYKKTLDGVDTNASNFNYANIQKQLQNINSVCACPHVVKKKVELPRKDPSFSESDSKMVDCCDQIPKDYAKFGTTSSLSSSAGRGKMQPQEKPMDCCKHALTEKPSEAEVVDCCGYKQHAEKYKAEGKLLNPCTCSDPDPEKQGSCTCDESDDTRSNYQNYNLSSISAIAPYFQSETNLYQPMPPFFYLYSGPYVRSQTSLHPVSKDNACTQPGPLPTDCSCSNRPHEIKQVNEICSCTSPEKSCDDLLMDQPSKQLCTCDSNETTSNNPQFNPTVMTYEKKKQTYLPTDCCATGKSFGNPKRMAKAAQSYLKNKGLDNCYSARKRSMQPPEVVSSTDTKCLSSKQNMTSCCESDEQQTPFQCNSDETLFSECSAENCESKSRYYKKYDTYSTDVPQRFVPVMPRLNERKTVSCNLSEAHKVNNAIILPSTSISVPAYPSFSRYSEEESFTISDTNNSGGKLNDIQLKQLAYFSPCSQEDKPGCSCLSDISFSPFGSAKSKHCIVIAPRGGTDNYTLCNDKFTIDSLHNIVKIPYILRRGNNQDANSVLCSLSSTSLLKNADPQSSYLVSYKQSIAPGTNDLDSSIIKEWTSSPKRNRDKNNGSHGTLQTSSTSLTLSKDFSVYITMTPQDNFPYKAVQNHFNAYDTYNANNSCTPTFKDCSTYVTAIPKKRSGVKKNTCAVFEVINKIEFFEESFRTCYGFPSFDKKDSCGSAFPGCMYLVPYTREGQPGPCGLAAYEEFAKNNTLINEKKGSAILMDPLSNACRSDVVCTTKQTSDFTRKDMPRTCCIPKIKDIVNSHNYPLPYTRENQPGPCGLPDAHEKIPNTCDIQSQNNKISKDSTYIKVEGRYPYDLSLTKNTFSPCTNIRSKQSITLEAYTRKWRHITSHENKTPGLFADVDSKQANEELFETTYNTPYTREGQPGPCGLAMIHMPKPLLEKRDSGQLRGFIPYTREGRAGPSDTLIINTERSQTNENTRHISNLQPYTREGRPGPSDLYKTKNTTDVDKNSIDLSNQRPYQIPCISNTERSRTSDDRRQISHPLPYTREGRPVPPEFHKTSYSTDDKEISKGQTDLTPCPRESRYGCYETSSRERNTCTIRSKKSTDATSDRRYCHENCSTCVRNRMACSVHPIDITEFMKFVPFTREQIHDSFIVTRANPISRPFCNTTIKRSSQNTSYKSVCGNANCKVKKIAADSLQSAHMLPYTREGAPGPCGLPLHNVPSWNPAPYTREGVPGPIDMYKPSNTKIDANNTITKLSAYTTLYAKEISQAPWGLYKKCMVCSSKEECKGSIKTQTGGCSSSSVNSKACESSTDLGLVTAKSKHESTESEKNSILESLYNKLFKSYKARKAERKSRSCRQCESNSNGKTCPLCNIDLGEMPHLSSRVGMPGPGPCGTSDACDTTGSLANIHVKPLPPYTREGSPGPCGIFEQSLIIPRFETFASYACLLNDGSFNVYQSNNNDSDIESRSQQGQRRQSDKKECHYCDTQSCLMCQIYTTPLDGTKEQLDNGTKDASTYVTATPCSIRNTCEEVLRPCRTCHPKSTASLSGTVNFRHSKSRVPHIPNNVSRSLNNLPYLAFMPNAITPNGPVMIVRPYMFLRPPSAVGSKSCTCKSYNPSVPTLRSAPNCNKSEHSTPSNKICSLCGRTQPNKEKFQTASVPALRTCDICDKAPSNRVTICEPCSGCGKTKLVVTCASNPSESIAIATCSSGNRFTESKTASDGKERSSIEMTLCPHCQKYLPDATNVGSKKRRVKSHTHISTSGATRHRSSTSLISKHSKAFFDENKLGYYEFGLKQVTKIYKHKNPDGTMTNEKHVITIKTEKKCPEKDALEAGTVISSSMANEKENCKNNCFRQSQSEVLQRTNDLMTSPKIRSCISVHDCHTMKDTSNKTSVSPAFDFSTNFPKVPICANRLKDSDSGPKCRCDEKANRLNEKNDAARPVPQNLIRDNKFKDIDSRVNPSIPTPTVPVYANRLQNTANDPRCNSNSDASSIIGSQIDRGVQSPAETSTPICANRLHDTDSGPKCDCANKSLAKQTEKECCNKPQDTEQGPNCDGTKKSAPKATERRVCGNRLQDIDSGPKCDCPDKSPPEPTEKVCVNRLQDTDSGPKCDCGDKLPPKPTEKVCCNILQYTGSGQKCDGSNKSPPRPTERVCGNRLQDTDSGPKCDCPDESPPKPTEKGCGNRLQDTGSGRKCNGSNKSPPRSTERVCGNRLQDTDSGAKCDCGDKSPPKPTERVCGNRLKDTDSGPKCDCPDKSPPKPTGKGCCNRSQDTGSGRQCDGSNKSPRRSTERVCGNRLQDTDSGPKCNCGDKSPPKPSKKICDDRLHHTDSGPKCGRANKSSPIPTQRVCGNRLQDTDSGPKCDCGDKSSPKPKKKICGDRLHDTDSGQKCSRTNKSSPIPTQRVCGNRLQDTDSGPKCDCAEKPPPKPTERVCGNRLEDTDSGPKCDCPDKPPPKPTEKGCCNRSQDTGSGRKCDGSNKSTPRSTERVCGNRLQDTDSGPKCDCGDKSPPKSIGKECGNRLQDTDSGPKCDCPDKSPPKTTERVCGNRVQDTDRGPKCDWSNKSVVKSTAPMIAQPVPSIFTCGTNLNIGEVDNKPSCMSTAPVCANRQEDSDSVPRCACDDTKQVDTNRLQTSESGRGFDYADKSSLPKTQYGSVYDLRADHSKPKPGTHVCSNKSPDPKCSCTERLAPRVSNPICCTIEKSYSGSKCSCEEQSISNAQELLSKRALEKILSPLPMCSCLGDLKQKLLQKILATCELDVIKDILNSPKTHYREDCCFVRNADNENRRSELAENRLYENSISIAIPNTKTVCHTSTKCDVICSTTDLQQRVLESEKNRPNNKITESTFPVKIVPKRSASVSKPSIFRASILDALRHLFHTPKSQTQDQNVEKNICNSPDSLNSELFHSCSVGRSNRETFSDDYDDDYRLTNYCTEPETPASKRSASPFGQINVISRSKNCSIYNTDVDISASMVSKTVASNSDDSLSFLGADDDNCCSNSADGTGPIDPACCRVFKKGKIEYVKQFDKKHDASKPNSDVP